MMASAGALPQTLKSITETKIEELSKQRVLFEKRKAAIIATANATPDLRTRARVLLDGLSRLKGYPKDALDKDDLNLDVDSSDEDETEITSPGMGQMYQADHVNIRRFLLQGRYDPSISDSAVKDWITRLENDLRFLELKHEHASFYSKLVTEWLTHLNDASKAPAIDQTDDAASAKSDASFEKVGRKEMHEQRAQWESLVFTNTTQVKEDSINAYLDGLFQKTKLSRQALKELRESLHRFGTNLATKGEWLDVEELQWVSQALMGIPGTDEDGFAQQ